MENRIDIEKLISEVHARPAIWDMTHSDYMDRTVRKSSWEEIVSQFAGQHMPIEEKKTLGEVLHKKWKNVRDRYAREMQARRGKSGSTAVKKMPYMHAEQLAFLQDTVLPRKTTSSLHLEVGDSNSGPSTEAETRIETVPSRRPQLWKKRKLHSVEAKIFQALEKNRENRERRKRAEDDDNRHFLLSLLPHLKALPRALNMKARVDIMQCIMKYEFEMAHDNGQNQQRRQYLTMNAQINQMQQPQQEIITQNVLVQSPPPQQQALFGPSQQQQTYSLDSSRPIQRKKQENESSSQSQSPCCSHTTVAAPSPTNSVST